MDTRTLDASSAQGTDVRRRRLLAVAGAGIVALLGRPGAALGTSKGKKRCNREKQQCRQQIRDFCGVNQSCLESFLQCCESCKVGAGIICALSQA